MPPQPIPVPAQIEPIPCAPVNTGMRQQCVAQARQNYANVKADVEGVSQRAGLIAGVLVVGAGVGGCLVGDAAGRVKQGEFWWRAWCLLGCCRRLWRSGTESAGLVVFEGFLAMAITIPVTEWYENRVADQEFNSAIQACS